MEVMEKENLCENSANIGEYIKSRIETELSHAVKEVRGMGLMIGVELKEPVAKKVNSVLLNEYHYLIGVIGDSTFRIVPPLIITKEDADGFIEALKKSI
jgi:4-aminobutyrate aminotransferase-like enzyme